MWILYTSIVLYFVSVNAQETVVPNAENDVYGNEVKMRDRILDSTQGNVWLLKDRPLPTGELTRFYVYVHPRDGADAVLTKIKLQVWRPSPSFEDKYMLLKEMQDTIDASFSGLKEFNPGEEIKMFTEDGDVIGWTIIEGQEVVSLDFTETQDALYRSRPNNGLVEGVEYSFERTYPAEFSIAAKVITQAECKRITAHPCDRAQNLPYNSTSLPNFFGHQHQDQAEQSMQAYLAIMETGCSPALDEFICLLYVPECGYEKRYPCRSLCESIKLECAEALDDHRQSWPSELNCTTLPEDDCIWTGCDPRTEFTCANDRCTYSAWVCDGEADCTDASDEDPTLCANTPCLDDEFECVSNRERREYPACIPMMDTCDEIDDCIDGEDESEELCSVEVTCPPGDFQCEGDTCIPQALRCDHKSDCPRADDEEDCVYEPCPGESAGKFECQNKQCIDKHLVCDGERDCYDNSDEVQINGQPLERCVEQECDPLSHFRCTDMSCIASGLICNGESDCQDNSDEDSALCENLAHQDCFADTCGQGDCVDTLSGHYCNCYPGYEIKDGGNGKCEDIDECTITPLACGQICENSVGNFTCSCQNGYMVDSSDRTACIPDPSVDNYEEPWLMFANELYIRRFDIMTEELSSVSRGHTLAHVVDYDYRQRRIFFGDARVYKIRSMGFDGTETDVINEHHTLSVEGIAVDWIAENIYWSSSSLDGIYVSQVNGRYPSHLIKDVSNRPRALALDPREGVLFWTDWDLDAFIGRVGMDGSNMRKDIIKDNIFWPNGLTIDYTTKRIYWIDAHLDRIESADYEGGNRYVVVNDAAHGYSLNIFADTVYWSEWNLKRIEVANKRDGSSKRVMLDLVHVPFGMHIVHKLKQPDMVNPCENSPCEQLCLVAPGGNSYTCACTSYYSLKDDNQTCTAECNEAQYECQAPDQKCIPIRWFCDGEADCEGGDDEPDDHEHCLDRTCPPGSIQCRGEDVSNCIRHSQVCDTIEHCPGGTDEENCNTTVCAPYEFRCESGQCIPDSYECDEENDCFDGSDEHSCKRTCEDDEFTCNNGNCIPKLWYCDWDDDCGDMSDEPRDWCWENTVCPEGWIRCSSNYRCIPALLLCDGNDNCRDNSDESPERCAAKTCDGGDYTCADGGCIPMRWKCDFSPDCDDNSDEGEEVCPTSRPCSEDEFQCNDGRCIRNQLVCDYSIHCSEAEDEIGCTNETTCSPGYYQCNSGHCIEEEYKCDQFADCRDGSDESKDMCPPPRPDGTYCPSYMFTCEKTGICTDIDFICDGHDDCYDNSDEQNCQDAACHAANRFQCNTGHCIYSFQVCNGIPDCEDGEDESDAEGGACHVSQCPFRQFTCIDGSGCLSYRDVCDLVEDCNDGSDEMCDFNKTCTSHEPKGGCADKCNQVENGYFCTCTKPGFVVNPENPRACIDVDECEKYEQNMCSQQCDNRDESYVCQCSPGFHPETPRQFNCMPVNKDDLYLLIADSHEFLQYFMEDDSVHPLVSGHRGVDAIDFDIHHRIVYYADETMGIIRRTVIPTDTTEIGNPQDFVVADSGSSISGVAYEWKGGLVFWSDRNLHTIKVVKEDGTSMKTLIEGDDTFNPEHLVVDSERGQLYWVNSVNSNVTMIEKSFLHGRGREGIVSSGLRAPTALAVDHYQEGRIYWCDLRTRYIESVNHDGSDRTIVMMLDENTAPFGFDVFAGSIYWTSRKSSSVYQRRKKPEISASGEELGSTTQLLQRLYGVSTLRVFHGLKYRTDTVNQCTGQCSHLCFAMPGDRHECACGDNQYMDMNSGQCRGGSAGRPLLGPTLCSCAGNGYCAPIPNSDQAECICDPNSGMTGESCNVPTTTTTTTISTSPSAPATGPTTTTTSATTTNTPSTRTASTSTTTTSTTTSATTSAATNENGGSQPQEKKSGGGGNGGGKTAAIVIPIVIILLLLFAVAVAIFFWTRKNKAKQGAYVRENLDGNNYDQPGVENANDIPIKFENGGAVRFSNPLYDKPKQSGEEMMGQEYASVDHSDVNLNMEVDDKNNRNSST